MQKTFTEKKPTLYIVSTPIGNLMDFSLRAIETLKIVSVIYAEDTRTSSKLLKHYQIQTPMRSYHEHNKDEREKSVLETLQKGLDIALISDAGTPCVSDPGYEMVRLAIEHQYHVTPIPGASAMLSALVVSGLPTDQFTFIGFLPKKLLSLEQKLKSLREITHTMIFYESPNRISKTLEQMLKHLGNRRIMIARELTKMFESIIRTDLKAATLMTHDTRGEYVMVIEGTDLNEDYSNMEIIELVQHFKAQGFDEKDAMKLCAKHKKITKSDVYKIYKIKHQKS